MVTYIFLVFIFIIIALNALVLVLSKLNLLDNKKSIILSVSCFVLSIILSSIYLIVSIVNSYDNILFITALYSISVSLFACLIISYCKNKMFEMLKKAEEHQLVE